MAVKPLESFTLPVSADDMAAYLGLATPLSVADNALLEGMLATACDMVRSYCNREFLERKWSMTITRFGEGPYMRGVAPVHPVWDGRVKLPFAPVTSVEGVYAIDEDNTEFTLEEGVDYFVDDDLEPGQVRMEHYPIMTKLRVEFTAGYADEYEIPAQMLLAVKMLTAWLYEHRGVCDAAKALMASGARNVLGSVMVRFGL